MSKKQHTKRDYSSELITIASEYGLSTRDWQVTLMSRGWRVWTRRVADINQARDAHAAERWRTHAWLCEAYANAPSEMIRQHLQTPRDNASFYLPKQAIPQIHVVVACDAPKGGHTKLITSYQRGQVFGALLRQCVSSVRNRLRRLRAESRATNAARPAGYYARLAAERVASALDRQHNPTDDRQWLAAEIECIVDSRDRLRTTLSASPLLRQHVTLKSDSSLAPSDPDVRECVEVVICAPRETFAAIVREVCAGIQAHRGMVNKSCGLHIHLDQRNREMAQVEATYTRLAAAQPLLQRFVSESRLGEEGRRYAAASPRNWSVSSRYRAINACAYRAHRTIEVRLHQGTVDATKIANWAALLCAIADCAWVPQRQRRVTAQWLDAYSVTPELRDYWLGRMAAFERADAPPASRPSRAATPVNTTSASATV